MAGITKEEREARAAAQEAEETATTVEEDGPVVLHARTIADEHFFVQAGSREDAVALQGEINERAPGQVTYEIHPLATREDVLAKYPAAEEEE